MSTPPTPLLASNSDFQLQIQLAVCDLTRRIADAAAAASAQGGDGAAVITRTVDAWVRVDDRDGDGRVPITSFFPPLWSVALPRLTRPNDLVDLVPAFAAAAWSFIVIARTIRDRSLNQAIHEAIDTILSRAETIAASTCH
ncbi:hypothetical protein [Mycolicibacterium helvum]|uniref:hypothetical protein n=1 Tax=Mycolicibacterium helvum TaxID=1534349 RepID=UPI001FE25538|nr:hypothetical protein [Mycolicibacterium helvum]